jgi:GNAT superfamily N-acetyltransferase
MSWEWADEIREKHIAPALPDGYRLERVDEDTYWDRHEAELRAHFGPEAYFDGEALAGEARRAARERLESGERLADHWLVFAADGSLAGAFSTCQRDAETFELHHVTMHPDHRGRGLYAELLARALAYGEELGFRITVSEHAPSNNAVLIRHLKAGFRIVALEISPLYGPAVRLAYFHDPALLRAYEFRNGLAVMDETLYAAGAGHFAALAEQFAASAPPTAHAACRSSRTPRSPRP